jgi:hypothetical protein
VEALAIIGARPRKQSGRLLELADVTGGENPYIDGDVAHAGGIVVRQIPTTAMVQLDDHRASHHGHALGLSGQHGAALAMNDRRRP